MSKVAHAAYSRCSRYCEACCARTTWSPLDPLPRYVCTSPPPELGPGRGSCREPCGTPVVWISRKFVQRLTHECGHMPRTPDSGPAWIVAPAVNVRQSG